MDLTNNTSGWELEENPLPTETGIIPHCIAVFGQANDSYTGFKNSPVQVADSHEAAEIFGQGSQLHRLIIPLAGVASKIVCFVVEKPVVGTAKIIELTMSAEPAENGRLTINVGNDSITVDYIKATSLPDIYTLIAQAINQNTTLPVTALAEADKAILTTKWADDSANTIIISASNNGVETIDINETKASGTVNLKDIFAAMSDRWYTLAVLPYTDSTVIMQAVQLAEEMLDPKVHRPMLMVAGSVQGYAEFKTSVQGYDSRCLMIVNVPASVTPAGEISADEVYKRIMCSQEQPNLSGRNIALRYTKPGNMMLSDSQKQTVTQAGGATVSYINGSVYVDNDCTTSKTIKGKPNDIWHWADSVLCNMAKVHTLNTMFSSAPFDDYIMVDEKSTTVKPKALKPSTVKQYLRNQMKQWNENAWSKNLDDMQKSIQVFTPRGNPRSYLIKFMDDYAVAGRRIFVEYAPTITSKAGE